MEDVDLERKIKATREAISESELSDEHKEALHESLDQAAKSANGSPEKLHDLTVAFCKGVLRSARSDISFKNRVIDAVSGPLNTMKDEILDGVAKMLKDHVISCPNQYVKPAPTTLYDVALAAAKNPWFYFAVSAIAFSPNAVAIIDRIMK
jgi:hypothetical protein